MTEKYVSILDSDQQRMTFDLPFNYTVFCWYFLWPENEFIQIKNNKRLKWWAGVFCAMSRWFHFYEGTLSSTSCIVVVVSAGRPSLIQRYTYQDASISSTAKQAGGSAYFSRSDNNYTEDVQHFTSWTNTLCQHKNVYEITHQTHEYISTNHVIFYFRENRFVKNFSSTKKTQ